MADPVTDRPGDEHAVAHICLRIAAAKRGSVGLYVRQDFLIRSAQG